MRRKILLAPLATALTAAALVAMLAAPAHADPQYPTWDQVEKAKSSASAAQTEYNRITGMVAQLQKAATAAAATELKKQIEYSTAQNAADAAAKKAQSLQAQAADAKTKAQSAAKRYGSFVSQFYITGGNSGVTTQLLLQPGNGTDLLRKLGTMSQLTGHSAQLRDQASQSANLANSLSAQAADADAARQKLAADAQQKLKAAQAAQQAAESALAVQQKQSQVLYAQAAALKKNEAATEKLYWDGVAYRAAMAAQEAANGDAQRLYQVSQTITPNPAAAKAYASTRMAAYGWGNDQYQCLLQLWTIESGWRVNAYNTSSAAYGIPQALPANKMASYGSDWMTNYVPQINWGLDYIRGRYSTPCGALAFETSHTPYWY